MAAAACFLPLTSTSIEQGGWARGTGRRLVSPKRERRGRDRRVEETGLISIVVDGQIERGLDADTLRSRLRSLVLNGARRRPRERFSHLTANMSIWPFRHIGMKLLLARSGAAVVDGCGWRADRRTSCACPLELQQFPPALELVGDFTTAVDVRVRGSAGALSRVTAGDIVAVLDLRGAEPGPRLFRLTPDDVRAPFGVEIVQVNPRTVAMTFVNPALRHVPEARGGGPPVERTVRDRPLGLRNLPANLTASATPGQVDVTLTGAGEALVRSSRIP